MFQRMLPGISIPKIQNQTHIPYSIRINPQYRISFICEEGHAYEIEITDYH